MGRALLIALAAGLAAGCSPIYAVKSAAGHGRLLMSRRPFAEVLADPAYPAARKDKILLIEEARRFAFEEMGLSMSRDYTSLAPLDRPYVTYLVSGAKRLKLEPYRWWFPVIGRVPYKGHFSKKDALSEKESLERRGWDAYVSGATAYNTPLWFADPLPDPVLDWPEGDLAALVIHELVHGTVFFKGQIDFDESLADFMGDKGAEQFLAKRFGAGSPELSAFKKARQDAERRQAVFDGLYRDLEALYASASPDKEKLSRRETLFSAAQEKLRETDGPSAPRPNNAVVLLHRLYESDAKTFEFAYERADRDWRRFLELVRALDPKRPRDDLKAKTGG